ncbi:MAG: histidine kinase [Hespellia sp.]|nr:histidine kinase [Hespellia sp.]
MKFIFGILFIMLIPFICLLAVTQDRTQEMEQESARTYLSANLATVSGSIDGILTNVEKFYVPMLIDKDFNNTVQNISPYIERDLYQDFQDSNLIRDTLLTTAVTNNYIDSIYVYSCPADRLFSSKVSWNPLFHHYKANDSGWLEAYYTKEKESSWLLTASAEDDKPILTSYREMREQQTLFGVLSINIDAAEIAHQLKTVTPDTESTCFMTDTQLNMICASETGEEEAGIYQTVLKAVPSQANPDFFSVKVGGEKMFVFSLISGETDFRYFIVTPASSINSVSSTVSSLLRWYFFWIFLLIVLFILLAAFLFFRPIKRLIEGMRAVQGGDFDARLPHASSYEIDYINEHFNSMTENIQILICENYEQQISRKNAEIQNILNQLNEHFLYNTLDSIRWMARLEDAQKTSDMVFALAKFYRINLSFGQAFIKISQLVEMLESYLMLQKIHMENQFTYTLNCDEALLNRKVLRYLFQPIIENSLVHGRDGSRKVLDLQITLEIRDGRFHFCVLDNGTGISPQMIQQIYQSLTDDSSCSMEHFALKMIHKQLQLEYHLTETLLIDSQPGSYCQVEFYIPLSELEETI